MARRIVRVKRPAAVVAVNQTTSKRKRRYRRKPQFRWKVFSTCGKTTKRRTTKRRTTKRRATKRKTTKQRTTRRRTTKRRT